MLLLSGHGGLYKVVFLSVTVDFLSFFVCVHVSSCSVIYWLSSMWRVVLSLSIAIKLLLKEFAHLTSGCDTIDAIHSVCMMTMGKYRI